MRMTTVVVAGLLMAAPVAAQPWEEYVNTDDGFKVNFPGQPTVTEMTWQSQLDYRLLGREYTVERGRERYSVHNKQLGGRSVKTYRGSDGGWS